MLWRPFRFAAERSAPEDSTYDHDWRFPGSVACAAINGASHSAEYPLDGVREESAVKPSLRVL